MKTLEAAIDDYFHAMVRTHPWNKKRFEAALEPMSVWFDQQFGPVVPLASFSGDAVKRYLDLLPAAERPAALVAVRDFCTWLVAWDWLPQHPLAVAGVMMNQEDGQVLR